MAKSYQSELLNGPLLNDCSAREKKVTETSPTDREKTRVGHMGNLKELLSVGPCRATLIQPL